jgi:hypothetical protein
MANWVLIIAVICSSFRPEIRSTLKKGKSLKYRVLGTY